MVGRQRKKVKGQGDEEEEEEVFNHRLTLGQTIKHGVDDLVTFNDRTSGLSKQTRVYGRLKSWSS